MVSEGAMQHWSYLVGLAWCLALWLVYVYRQHLDLAWLFAIVSRLRCARKARGWSIEEAAWQVGVDTSTYHRWELGVQKPHGRNLRKLEAAFQMRGSDLFEEDLFEKELEKLVSLLLTEFTGDHMAVPTSVDMTGADIEMQCDGHLYLCQMKSYS